MSQHKRSSSEMQTHSKVKIKSVKRIPEESLLMESAADSSDYMKDPNSKKFNEEFHRLIRIYNLDWYHFAQQLH